MLTKDEVTALDKVCFPEEPTAETEAAWVDIMGGNEMNKLLWMGYKLIELSKHRTQKGETK